MKARKKLLKLTLNLVENDSILQILLNIFLLELMKGDFVNVNTMKLSTMQCLCDLGSTF